MLPVALIGAATLTLAITFRQDSGRQEPKTLESVYSEPVKLRYLVALPQGYGESPDKKWPLLLFLHGAGESGTDLNKVKAHGPPKLIEQGKNLPFIVVSPQAESWDVGWRVNDLSLLLDTIEKDYQVDTDREYVTGLSMGGFGTFALAMAQPKRFAAIAPVCGGGLPRLAHKIAKVPAWIFHGAKDSSVLPEESQRMYEALKGMGAEVKLTMYPDAAHDSWTETYNNPELYEWLLQHTLQSKSRSGAKRS